MWEMKLNEGQRRQLHHFHFTVFVVQKPKTNFVLHSAYSYRGADKSLTRPGRKQDNVSVRMAWISFGTLLCRGGGETKTARISMLLKSRASLTCFRACFLPVRAKDLSAPRVQSIYQPTKAGNKIQFITNKPLHVSAPVCHPQGVFRTRKRKTNMLIQVLHRVITN